MEEKLYEILEDLRPDVDFHAPQKLIDDEVLDSFDIVSLVGELNDAFDVEINIEELTPDNFNTPKAMLDLICKLQQEQ